MKQIFFEEYDKEIAKNLTLAQGGTFEIQLDGDLFKVFMTFPLAAAEISEVGIER